MTSLHDKHPLSAAIHFFKIILTTHGKLKLPKNFTRKYGDGISNPVFLKPPDGTEWKIYWTKHDGETWFQKGWKEFATFYSLDHGHLLLFEYKETSHFDLHIFDNSALEIDYPSHATHDGKDKVVQISDDSDEILDDHMTIVKSTLSSPPPCKKMKNSITTNVERSTNGVNLHRRIQTRSTSSQKTKFIKQELDEDESKGVFNTECTKVEQLTSTALTKATAFRSEQPFFTLVMKPTYIIGYYLDIPREFSKQYLKRTHAVVILEVLDGRSWPVIYSAPRINGGWQKFASENNLKVGDVCVFELIQKIQGLTFKVFIFPAISQDLPKCSIEGSSTNWTGGSSSKRSSLLQSHVKSEILTTGALKEASKFTSKNPFFMATLTLEWKAIKIPRCPYVPTNFVRKYFTKKKRGVMMIQFRKNLWPVKFAFHSSGVSGMFSVGWHSFARENELQIGDVCIFELVNGEDGILDLHVFRDQCEFSTKR
ncbi:B3 domain-containing transcription factor VRN1 isoform X2 [Cajanus cajan]|uniref:B3 domain-containing transcription factor VRN1 isoform X2 n=1 Tax=Cajanus cajan TaxID=3821 RepID=UPI00098D77AB|nr:B3 domain-containing transcription factor VRN1 isoform X2 [Cajanus cajan]